MLTLKNNFKEFKENFKADTGKDANSNTDAYIAYYNARCNDTVAQILVYMLSTSLPEFKNSINTSLHSVFKKEA